MSFEALVKSRYFLDSVYSIDVVEGDEGQQDESRVRGHGADYGAGLDTTRAT